MLEHEKCQEGLKRVDQGALIKVYQINRLMSIYLSSTTTGKKFIQTSYLSLVKISKNQERNC
jgi:hypothetical protein